MTSCTLPGFPTTTTTTTTRPMKRFEVAEVPEESESPPLSDLSAQSSSENVAREVGMLSSHPHRTEPPDPGTQPLVPPTVKKTSVQTVMGGLESASDSHIGSGGRGTGAPEYLSQSCTPEPMMIDPHGRHSYSFTSHGQPYQAAHNYGSYPYHWTVPSHPPPNVPVMPHYHQDHYNTTTYLPHVNYHYSLPTSSIYTSSHHHSNSLSAGSSQPHPPHETVPTHPIPAPSRAPTGQLPLFSDIPQADLLAKAFMTFLHSVGTVFRDPSFAPLLQSLDEHFESEGSAHLSTTDSKVSSKKTPPHSPLISPRQLGEQEIGNEQDLSGKSTALEVSDEADIVKMINK